MKQLIIINSFFLDKIHKIRLSYRKLKIIVKRCNRDRTENMCDHLKPKTPKMVDIFIIYRETDNP